MSSSKDVSPRSPASTDDDSSPTTSVLDPTGYITPSSNPITKEICDAVGMSDYWAGYDDPADDSNTTTGADGSD